MEFLRYLVYDLGFQIAIITLTLIIILLGIKCEIKIYKQLLFNISAIPIAILLFELFSSINMQKDNVSFSGTFNDNPIVSGDKHFLGYGPKDDTCFRVSSIRENNDELIYEVSYSFKNGRRCIPNNNDTSIYNVFFVGGSYFFGAGLNDNQTTPYFLNELSYNKYNLYNYAFSGYGAHQSLMIIEKKIINTLRRTKDKNAVIYLFIPSHIIRAAGNAIWDVNGPHYELINNELVYLGGFDDNRISRQNYLTKRIKIVWRNSHVYASFFEDKTSNKDIIRTREIIKRMQSLLAKYNCRFIVLIERNSKTQYLNKMLFEPMKNSNIELYYIDSIIDDVHENADKYKIIGDGHPNQTYNKRIADFLLYKLSHSECY